MASARSPVTWISQKRSKPAVQISVFVNMCLVLTKALARNKDHHANSLCSFPSPIVPPSRLPQSPHPAIMSQLSTLKPSEAKLFSKLKVAYESEKKCQCIFGEPVWLS
eukprot:1155841-Pelagomonas_calceolata.AAC.1